MSNLLQPVAILGAGAAGLSAAHELLSFGHRVHVFEAHSLPGGCASWFRRTSPVGSLQFDVGATVLDGLGPNAWLGQRLKHWGVELAPFEKMPQIFFKLRREDSPFELSTASIDAWISSLASAFPEDRPFIEKDLSRLARLGGALKKLVEGRPHFPMETVGDVLRNVRLLPKLPEVLVRLFGTGDFRFEDWLAKRPHSQRLREWIEMNLLITVQCASDKIYTPWAALALSFYPLGAGTLPGGMRGLMEPLLRGLLTNERATVSLRHRVSKISKIERKFFIDTVERAGQVKKFGPFGAVISAMSRLNTALIAPPDSFKEADVSWAKRSAELWGATTAYVALRDDPAWPDLAFNVHSKLGSGPGADGNDAYLSFSKRDDLSRAPAGWRVVTLSSHTDLKAWADLSETDYREKKRAAGGRLLSHLEAWAGRQAASFGHTEFGTPRTFERYTGRRGGHVGGFPMTFENTLSKPKSARTDLKGLYQIGDSTFPGQSVFACALGAVATVEKM